MKKRYALLAAFLVLVAASPLLVTADPTSSCESSDLMVKCGEDIIQSSHGYPIEFDCFLDVEIKPQSVAFQCSSSDLEVTSNGEPIDTGNGFPIGFPGEGQITVACCGGHG